MIAKKKKSPCEWCLNGVCRTSEDICDFKTLKKEPSAIKKRIDEEFDIIKKAFIDMKKIEEKEDMQKKMADVHDRLSGIKAMTDALREDFQEMYVPGNNPFEFTKIVLDAKIKSMKLERKKK